MPPQRLLRGHLILQALWGVSSSAMNTDQNHLVDTGTALRRSGIVHRVQISGHDNPSPVIIMLHGRSGSEDAMWIFSKVIPAGWIIVAPRGIKPDPDGGYAWHRRDRDEWPLLSMFDDAVASLTHFIGALPELYSADPAQLYLMGFSQGAAAAYALAMGYPGLVKGIVGLVGFVPVNSSAAVETTAMKDLPIFMAVGVDDPYIPLDRTQSCAETLRKSGALLAYHEYPTGHRLNAKGMRDLEAWLKARAFTP